MSVLIHAKRWAFMTVQLAVTGVAAVLTLALLPVVKVYTTFVRPFAWPVAPEPRCVLITGASYGLGAGFAEAYAGAGVTLALTARSAEKLEEVRAACEHAGADVIVGAIDVTDREAMEAFVAEVEAVAPIDLVIANAGISEASGGVERDLEGAMRLLTDVNLVGVYNTVFPVIRAMKTRRSGQVALLSSLAGYGGMPASTAYFTTKTALKAFGYGLRGQLARDNIAVSTLCPGFIRTPLTDLNKSPMPFLMDLDVSIAYMRAQLAANVGVIAFPSVMYSLVWYMQNMLPDDARDILFTPFLALKPRRARPSAPAAKDE